jgi:hypothetical protein
MFTVFSSVDSGGWNHPTRHYKKGIEIKNADRTIIGRAL